MWGQWVMAHLLPWLCAAVVAALFLGPMLFALARNG